MKKIYFLLALGFTSTVWANPAIERASIYRGRYNQTTLLDKAVDTSGKGDKRVYGTRNFRQILKGALFIGGGLNHKHRHPRDNRNPLQDDALENLCKEGFEDAYYLYSTNFNKAKKRVDCTSDVTGKTNTLNYSSIKWLENYNFLTRIHQSLTQTKGPLYVHCWNGWHASGYVGVIAMRQFCGMGAEEALRLWHKVADGTGEGEGKYTSVKNGIRKFEPFPGLQIDSRVKDAICPSDRF